MASAVANLSSRSVAAATSAAVSSRRRPMRTAASAAGTGANGADSSQQVQQAPRRRSLATLLVHSEGLVSDEFAASMPPIYQTATFQQPGAIDMGEYDYSRSGNPTRTVLEKQLAILEVGWVGVWWGLRRPKGCGQGLQAAEGLRAQSACLKEGLCWRT